MSWTIKKASDHTHIIEIDYDAREGWEQWILLSADRHWDNPYSDLKMQQRHLDEMVEKDGFLIDVGDLFCAMQGMGDPRSTKSSIRKEHNKSNYLDALVDTAAEWFSPYADHIALLAKGNHETGVYKRKETDLTKRLANRLGVMPGRYGGWIRLNFRDKPSKRSQNKYIRYFHGAGGGGRTTKGIQAAQRAAVDWPQADFVLQGHIHERWVTETYREHLLPSGKVVYRPQTFVQIPTYKEEHGKDGWHDQRGAPPKPLGAWWLRFYNKSFADMDYDLLRAA